MSLLPPNATDAERAVEATLARLSDVPVPLATLWTPDTCPAALLPWLAWAFSVEEEWDLASTEAQRRTLIAQAVELARYKGTPYGVRRAVALAGWPTCRILESLPVLRHQRGARHNARETYSGAGRWARYRVAVDLADAQGFTPADRNRVVQAATLWAPVRCHLDAVVVAPPLRVVADAVPAVAATVRAFLGIRVRPGNLHDGRLTRADAVRYARCRMSVSVGARVVWDGGATVWDDNLTFWRP